MRYLGLTLDSHWSFRAHFEGLGPRVEGAAAVMARLLPNLGGPREEVRRLYVGVVRSMILYGSPIWAGELTAGRRSWAKVEGVQRRLAVRIVRGYRTISARAALVLARVMPFDLQAKMEARVYWKIREGCGGSGGDPLPEQEIRALRLQARQDTLAEWRRGLEESSSHRTVGAILTNWDGWLGRGWGRLSFRLTQVLTGNGCF
ncbi:uncharacterized protein LOC107274596, partial [Cephus cinctus]|uniref:Uncharacterized protein LOC107274596 n=1 Tax=Cephus cinctus TaxID=211228 RepID=A0AAJ7CG23_CEPCN